MFLILLFEICDNSCNSCNSWQKNFLGIITDKHIILKKKHSEKYTYSVKVSQEDSPYLLPTLLQPYCNLIATNSNKKSQTKMNFIWLFNDLWDFSINPDISMDLPRSSLHILFRKYLLWMVSKNNHHPFHKKVGALLRLRFVVYCPNDYNHFDFL